MFLLLSETNRIIGFPGIGFKTRKQRAKLPSKMETDVWTKNIFMFAAALPRTASIVVEIVRREKKM
jgi:hypothetical protein